MVSNPLLSIAIPAYNRPGKLMHSLRIFIDQISKRWEGVVEIVITDDDSPDDSLDCVRMISDDHDFIRYIKNSSNIGLENNLLRCTDLCNGEFLWIFGDDDCLECEDSIDCIVSILQSDKYDFIILNRTRCSGDGSRLMSSNWMNLDEHLKIEYFDLGDFCLTHGFISVIGFISVNIFRRKPYQEVDASKYLGTMYPQLGAMYEAFYNRPTLLVGKPLVRHRTLTQEEKIEELGRKSSEANFMSDVRLRNATYFSHPFVGMLNELMNIGAIKGDALVKIPENTVIDGFLVDFLIDSVHLSYDMKIPVSREIWGRTAQFFNRLPLDENRSKRICKVLSRHCLN